MRSPGFWLHNWFNNAININSFQPNPNDVHVQEHNVDAPAAIEECALCRQQKSIIRFLPCGDTGVCQDCSENWSHCWKCNMEIQSRVPKIHPGNLPGNGSECVVCTEPIQARLAFVPCGHTNCCMRCAQTIGNTDKKCPVCRKRIIRLLPLYKWVNTLLCSHSHYNDWILQWNVSQSKTTWTGLQLVLAT